MFSRPWKRIRERSWVVRRKCRVRSFGGEGGEERLFSREEEREGRAKSRSWTRRSERSDDSGGNVRRRRVRMRGTGLRGRSVRCLSRGDRKGRCERSRMV